ncbi:hypothetical protein A0128_06095 [Leptospira tipperaryensis]|uniref:Lipoprotein n=1 Tax=Leptospira tipperaryensis TaxID=2564040 RepID=A0A1D7UV83_9LEPT|nr:hypothetical protein [Leptospira tipperaryensis]AOP33454.1 hypothetical protein A0128_06095 [Leptospira tipperaryensis]
MKLITLFQISLVTFALAFLSCSNLGLDQDQAKKEDDKKKCNSALVAYLGCTSSNPTMGACDSLYLGVLGICGSAGGSGGSGGGGGGGGY